MARWWWTVCLTTGCGTVFGAAPAGGDSLGRGDRELRGDGDCEDEPEWEYDEDEVPVATSADPYPCFGIGHYEYLSGEVEPNYSYFRGMEPFPPYRTTYETIVGYGQTESEVFTTWGEEFKLREESYFYGRNQTIDEFDEDGNIVHSTYDRNVDGVLEEETDTVYHDGQLDYSITTYGGRNAPEVQLIDYIYENDELSVITYDIGPTGPDGVLESVVYVTHPVAGAEVREQDSGADGVIESLERWDRQYTCGEVSEEAYVLDIYGDSWPGLQGAYTRTFDHGRLVSQVSDGETQTLTYDEFGRLLVDHTEYDGAGGLSGGGRVWVYGGTCSG